MLNVPQRRLVLLRVAAGGGGGGERNGTFGRRSPSRKRETSKSRHFQDGKEQLSMRPSGADCWAGAVVYGLGVVIGRFGPPRSDAGEDKPPSTLRRAVSRRRLEHSPQAISTTLAQSAPIDRPPSRSKQTSGLDALTQPLASCGPMLTDDDAKPLGPAWKNSAEAR